MDALDLCELYTKNASKQKTTSLCKRIIKAEGDVALAICRAKRDGWWNDNIINPCDAILNAKGDRVTAMYIAKRDGWWDDKLCNPSSYILHNSINYNREVIIKAINEPWWDYQIDAYHWYGIFYKSLSAELTTLLCKAVYKTSGEVAFYVYKAKCDGWWDDSVADPQKLILDPAYYNAEVVELAKKTSWWKPTDNDVTEPLTLESQTLESSTPNQNRTFKWFVDNKKKMSMNVFFCNTCKKLELSNLDPKIIAVRCNNCCSEVRRVSIDDIINRMIELDDKGLGLVLNTIFTSGAWRI